jgi:hypothetical protein
MDDRPSGTITKFLATLAPAWILVASIIGQPECVRAQATLAAIVADESSRDFLPGVEVVVVQLQRSAKTDFFGEARVAGIAARSGNVCGVRFCSGRNSLVERCFEPLLTCAQLNFPVPPAKLHVISTL